MSSPVIIASTHIANPANLPTLSSVPAFRSSRSLLLDKLGVLKMFVIGIQPATILKKRLRQKSCEFYKLLKSTFIEHLQSNSLIRTYYKTSILLRNREFARITRMIFFCFVILKIQQLYQDLEKQFQKIFEEETIFTWVLDKIKSS